jgi:hypothetical protein
MADKDTTPLEPTPFEKFSSTMRKLMAVPKSAIVAQEKKWKKQRAEKVRRAKKKNGGQN